VRLKTNGVNVDRFFPPVIAETKKGSAVQLTSPAARN
jgi:hypothetical protein